MKTLLTPIGLVVFLAACTQPGIMPPPSSSDRIVMPYSQDYTVVDIIGAWKVLRSESAGVCIASQKTKNGVVALGGEQDKGISYLTLHAWEHKQDGSWVPFAIGELRLDDGTKYKAEVIQKDQTFFAYPINSDLLEHLSFANGGSVIGVKEG